MRGSSWLQACGLSVDAAERTPDHIRVMKSALRVGEARGKAASVQVRQATAPTATPAQPLEERSLLGAKLARGEFVTMVEIVPPKGIDIARKWKARGF